MTITTSGTTLTFNDSTTQTTAPVNTNANVNSVSAGTGISVNSTTGAVTVTNSGVTSVSAGTGISVSGSTGGVTITNTAPAVTAGEAKAWVNYNPSSQTIRASYNVSSITYNATGNFTVNFTNSLSDANYCVVTGVSYGGNNCCICAINTNLSNGYTTPTTSSFSLVTYNSTNTTSGQNPPYLSIAVYR